MSAIIALLSTDKDRFPEKAADRMLAAMTHRGEDAVGKWSDGSVVLGHRMRWTTEESVRESLPYRSRRTGCAITCDARIDNRDELISELDGTAAEVTDSELILLAYEKWGEACLSKLEGDFVFAIWDPRNEELLCARDQLGVKHFYYHHEAGKAFALASEVKALLSLSGMRCELNEQAIGDYLTFNFQDKVSTLFKGIFRLPATHAMSISLRSPQPRIWRYWSPDDVNELRLKSHADYHEAFRERFVNAVDARLRSAYPIGSMLSGGLDSSSITCAAAESLLSQGSQPINSYSVYYSETSKKYPELDEMQYMQSVITRSGCQPHFIDCDAFDALRDMPRLIRYADHPMGMANLHVHLECFKEAANSGVRVMLDGTDGDSTVSHGYEAFAQLAKRGRWLSLFNNARLLKAHMPQKAHSLENLAFRFGLDQIVPSRFQKPWYLLTRRGNFYSKRSYTEFDRVQWHVINKGFKTKLDFENRFQHMADEKAASVKGPIESHWHDLTSGHFARVLEFAELSSQSFGIEMRFPFFDRRLIEFCIAVPPAEKIYRGWTRSVFRHAMEGLLPPDVQWRTTKADLGPGFKLNLIKYRRAQIGEVVEASASTLDEYIDRKMLRRVYERFLADPFKSDIDTLILISVVQLKWWLEENSFGDLPVKR